MAECREVTLLSTGKKDDCTLAIRLSWRKTEPPGGSPTSAMGR